MQHNATKNLINACITFSIATLCFLILLLFVILSSIEGQNRPESVGVGENKATLAILQFHTSCCPNNNVQENQINHTLSTTLSTMAEMMVEETLEYQNNKYQMARDSGDLHAYIDLICADYGIRPQLVEAMIQVESNWKPNATNGPHIGLMQINQNIHVARMEKLGVNDLFNPFDNVLVGVDLLSDLLKLYNWDEGAALVAYNTGSYKGYYTNYATMILELASN